MTEYAPVLTSDHDAVDGTHRSTGWTGGGPAPDRRRLETARDWLRSGGSILVFGRTATGKSTLLDAVAAAAGPMRTLRCTPHEAAADLPFFALTDLLSSVKDAELGLLPPAQRGVLAGALRRAAHPGGAVTPAAVRLAALNLLRILAQAGPLLLVVDDIQRLDQATADLLRFVAARVGDLPVWVAAAECIPGDCPPVGRPLCPAPLLLVRLEVASVDAVYR